jgi:hypothetical protein
MSGESPDVGEPDFDHGEVRWLYSDLEAIMEPEEANDFLHVSAIVLRVNPINPWLTQS